MDAKRLLTFVGVGLIVIGTLAAAVAVAGPTPRTHAARTGAGSPGRMRAGARGTLPAANNFYPTGIEYDSARGEVFVADAAWDNVSVISDATNAIVANIHVGANPFGLAYDSGKGEVFVADQVSNNVSVISDTTNTVVATIGVGGRPFGAAYDGGKGEVFVANQASNTVSVMSDATNTVVAT